MSFHHTIACPDCGSPIPIESTQLLAGQSFRCSNQSCHVSISLSSSEVGRVTEAFDKFSALREEAIQQSK